MRLLLPTRVALSTKLKKTTPNQHCGTTSDPLFLYIKIKSLRRSLAEVAIGNSAGLSGALQCLPYFPLRAEGGGIYVFQVGAGLESTFK